MGLFGVPAYRNFAGSTDIAPSARAARRKPRHAKRPHHARGLLVGAARTRRVAMTRVVAVIAMLAATLVAVTAGMSSAKGLAATRLAMTTDVSGDGYADLLLIRTDNTMWYYPNSSNSGNGFFPTGFQIGAGWGIFSKIAAGDVNHDGRADILGIKPDGTLWYYPNSGDPTNPYTSTSQIGSGWSTFTKFTVGDINNDGYADLLGVTSGGLLDYFPNTKSPTSPYGSGTLVSGAGWNTLTQIAAADVNHDGYADVVGTTSAGNVNYYVNSKNPANPYTSVSTIGTGWNAYTQFALGDLSGDGYADALTTKSDDSEWYFANNPVVPTAPFPSTPSQVAVGWSGTPPTGPAIGGDCGKSGTRSGAQMKSHSLTDAASMAFNPTNGNLALKGTLLHMAGVGVPLSINWRYNAINDYRPTLNVGLNEAALQPTSGGGFTFTQDDGGCYTFNKSGTTWTTPAGINATLTKNGSGQMDLRMNPSGIHYVYSQVGSTWELVKQTDSSTSSPNTMTYTYAASGGKLSKITDTQGRVITFAYTDANNTSQPSTITDTSLNRTISLVYGGLDGALSSVTNAAGDQLSFGYDTTGLTSITDNRSTPVTTEFSYDASSRLHTWTYAYGTSNAATFTAAYPSGSSTTITDPNSHVTTFTLSGGNVTTTTDANGNTTGTSWDGHNNLLSSTDELSNTSNMTYGNATNPNNMLSKITSPAGSSGSGAPAGASVSSTYPTSPDGTLRDYLPSTQTDAQGDTTTYTYDTKVYKQTAASQKNWAGTTVGGTSHETYQGDAAGTDCGAKPGEICTATNPNGGVTSYGYDSAGNVTTITPPSPLGARTLTYDAAGRLKSETDGRGNTEYYTYDGYDRITFQSMSSGTPSCGGGNVVCYQYDHAGNKTVVATQSISRTFGYDEQNRITSTSGLLGGGNTTATYDGVSNMLTYTDGGGTTTYRYDPANRLIAIAEPGGSCPSGTIPHPNSTKCISIDYQASGSHSTGRRAHVYDPNGQIVSTTYDNAGRILTISATNGGSTTFSSRTYSYQTGGSPNSDQSLRSKQVDQSGTTTYYCYDGFERLAYAGPTSPSCTGTLPTTGTKYSYDNDGNRTSALTSSGGTYAGYNNADELCFTATTSGGTCATPPTGATSYTSDGTGNQTTDTTGTNTWTTFNQLQNVNGAGSSNFTYSDSGNDSRTQAQENGDNVEATLGPLGTTATKDDTTLVTTEFVRDPKGTLMAMQTGGSSYYYAEDALGSVISLSTSSNTLAAAYTYDPWGNLTSTPPTGAAANNPFTYVAGYADSTGLIKFGARYYNPVTGRFNQPDPSRQEKNLYAYANDDPINRSDAKGLDFLGDVFGAISGAADVLTGFAAAAGGVALAIAGCTFGGPVGCVASGVAGLGLFIGGLSLAGVGSYEIDLAFHGEGSPIP